MGLVRVTRFLGEKVMFRVQSRACGVASRQEMKRSDAISALVVVETYASLEL